MMRAWAAISVVAVLAALPMSVEQAAGDGVGTDAVAPVAGSGVAVAAVPPTNLGVMLWLSVAVVAAVAACLVLHHSRTHFAAATEAARPVFPYPPGAAAGWPSGGADDAAPSTVTGD